MLTETLEVGSLYAKVRKLPEVWKKRQWPKVIESVIEPGPGDRSPASRARCLGRVDWGPIQSLTQHWTGLLYYWLNKDNDLT